MPARGDRYSVGAIAFHWTIAALVLFNLWLGLFRASLPREWQVMPVHKSLGITILVLTLGRIAWRLAHRPPPLPDAMPRWEKAASATAHVLLYALLLILPLTGWLMSSNPDRPRPFSWFFAFDIPLLPASTGAARIAHDAHENLGLAMTALVALHILAALRHHFLLRDSVLARMLPWAARNG
jgi:cytochrome b561